MGAGDFPLAEASAERRRAQQDPGAAEAQRRHRAETRTTRAVMINPRQCEANAASVLYADLKAQADYRAAHGTFEERRRGALEAELMKQFHDGKLSMRDLDYPTISVDFDGRVSVVESGMERVLDMALDVATPDQAAPQDLQYVDALGQQRREKIAADSKAYEQARAKGINPAHKFGKHTDLHPQPVVPTNHTYTTTSPTDAA